MSPKRDNPQSLRPVLMHRRAREAIRAFSKHLRCELGSALTKLQLGMTLGLPISRPMPTLAAGAHELRLRDEAGVARVFYVVELSQGILVFHAFTKKTEKTPTREIEVAKARLKEML